MEVAIILGIIGMVVSTVANLANANNTNQVNTRNVQDTNRINQEIQRETNELQMQLAGQTNDWSIAQWNRENAYNSPTAQMQRLRDAGINPALAYSDGLMNEAASSPAANMANVDAMRNIAPQIERANIPDPLTAANIAKLKAETQSITDANDRANEQQSGILENLQKQNESLSTSIRQMNELIEGIKSDNRKKAVEAYIAEQTRDVTVQRIQDEGKLTHDEAQYYVLNMMSEIGLRESQEELNKSASLLNDKRRDEIDEYIKISKEYLSFEREQLGWAREQFNASRPWLGVNAKNQASILSSRARIEQFGANMTEKYGEIDEVLQLLRVFMASAHDGVEMGVDVFGRHGKRGTKTITRTNPNKTVVVSQ